METKRVTVQSAVEGMIKASKNSFVIPKGELKDFYFKFAFPLDPDSCSINHTEFELLNILLKDLKKIPATLAHLSTHPWDEDIAEIQISCGVYSLQDNLSKKERMQMNTSMGRHLQFLTQMAVNSPIFKLLFKNYHGHYIQVESLVKQMAKEINEQQQQEQKLESQQRGYF